MKERGEEEEEEEEGESSLNLKMVEKAWIAVSLYPLSSSRFRKHLKKDPSLIIKDPRTTENNRSERKELPKELVPTRIDSDLFILLQRLKTTALYAGSWGVLSSPLIAPIFRFPRNVSRITRDPWGISSSFSSSSL